MWVPKFRSPAQLRPITSRSALFLQLLPDDRSTRIPFRGWPSPAWETRILTACRARASHAAVVARSDLEIDRTRRCCRFGGRKLNEDDPISLDGNKGAVRAGTLEVMREPPEQALEVVANWSSLPVAL